MTDNELNDDIHVLKEIRYVIDLYLPRQVDGKLWPDNVVQSLFKNVRTTYVACVVKYSADIDNYVIVFFNEKDKEVIKDYATQLKKKIEFLNLCVEAFDLLKLNSCDCGSCTRNHVEIPNEPDN